MRLRSSCAALPFLALCGVVSCSPAEAQGEPAEEAATTGAVVGADGYFGVTADLRACASPVCGGWFVHRLNRAATVCHDGRPAAACYTPVLDWSEAKLSDAQQAKLRDAARVDAGSGSVYAIVRGRFAPSNRTTPRPDLGALVVTAAWIAETDTASDGVFVMVKDNGLRCFAAPCPSMTETTLNTAWVADIAEIDFTATGLGERAIEACRQEIATPAGLLIAGHRYLVHDNGSTGKACAATAVYQPLADAAP